MYTFIREKYANLIEDDLEVIGDTDICVLAGDLSLMYTFKNNTKIALYKENGESTKIEGTLEYVDDFHFIFCQILWDSRNFGEFLQSRNLVIRKALPAKRKRTRMMKNGRKNE